MADTSKKSFSSLKIALAGNPNSGKTTLFNTLTGLNQKVGNFPGITVEKKTGYTTISDLERKVELIDLPGSYSIYPKSLDERVQSEILVNINHKDHPDLIVYVADASSLKRSLFLCSQLIDLEIPMILVLNMMDIVEKEGKQIDTEQLEAAIGIPVLLMKARENFGVEELKTLIAGGVQKPYTCFINQDAISSDLVSEIQDLNGIGNSYTAFQLASNFNILSDETLKARIEDKVRHYGFNAIRFQRKETLERYKKINNLLKDIWKEGSSSKAISRVTQKLDNLFTHKVYGFLFFLIVLFVVFQSIFSWSSYPMELLEGLFVWVTGALKANLPQGVLTDLLVDGVLAGLSGILIFIPQIALLFLFIAILEDTGYMARVSFIMDKLMRKFGLNGRSVIPLISGVACAVPAIMSARTISNWKERMITIMVTPLMSCSARLPVYTLLIALAVPSKKVIGFLSLQGLVMMGLYLIGFVAAIGSAWVMKKVLKARERSYFIMELPIYRSPRWSSIGLIIVEKLKLFIFEAGKVIVAISIVLWVLSSYAPSGAFEKVEEKYSTEATLNETQRAMLEAEKLEASYAGVFGKAIEPVIKPLGFDWKIGIALITSFAAREVFVGTMATIYSAGNQENNSSIREKMSAEINPETGGKRYNFAVALSLMIFYAFAMQCMSTLAVVYAETKSWKWPLIQFTYMSFLAYFSSLIVYQALS